MFRVLPHYALLLFALLVSLRWLGACWGPNVMEGAAILTSASELAKQPSRTKGLAQSPGTRHLVELKVSLCCGALRYLGLPERLVNFPGFPKMMQVSRVARNPETLQHLCSEQTDEGLPKSKRKSR